MFIVFGPLYHFLFIRKNVYHGLFKQVLYIMVESLPLYIRKLSSEDKQAAKLLK